MIDIQDVQNRMKNLKLSDKRLREQARQRYKDEYENILNEYKINDLILSWCERKSMKWLSATPILHEDGLNVRVYDKNTLTEMYVKISYEDLFKQGE